MWIVRKLLQNHVLANATFVVVLIVGLATYLQLPREQDPEVNFNWINILTALPGASAEDVEKLITDPLEESIHNVPDIKFVSSTSREGSSTILIRFNDISERDFDKRLNDLRREIQNKANAELPDDATDPHILEITSSNQMPMATVVVSGNAEDEVLRSVALNVKTDLETIKGVEKVNSLALTEPEIHVEFYPDLLQQKGITATQVADSVTAYFRDTAAGDVDIAEKKWLVRVIGTNADPKYIGQLPIIGTDGEVLIDTVAKVSRANEDPKEKVTMNDRPAVMFGVMKRAYVNTLELVERVNQYIEDKNKVTSQFGVTVTLLDDQSTSTRKAIRVMQSNALLGLIMVMFVTWLFLGAHIAIFLGIGIPFTLAGTFWILNSTGQTLNQSVLLGVVIVLGMLVDDAVVVVEAMYYRMQRGAESLQAALDALKEVMAPVTSSVLTTMAAFLPLMLLPGILGDFMFVIPFVVTVALALSLAEAYWILPVHVSSVRTGLSKTTGLQGKRIRFTQRFRIAYGRSLLWVFRRPKRSGALIVLLMSMAILAFATNLVKVQFFAFDPIRLFYINVQMAPGSTLDQTLNRLQAIEKEVRRKIRPEEVRGISAVAGQMLTQMEPYFGENYGYVAVTLKPHQADMRAVDEIVDSMRKQVLAVPGTENTSFFILEGGPPKGKPISVKVRGDDFEELNSAVKAIRGVLNNIDGVLDITDDSSKGKLELRMRFDTDAMRRAALSPAELSRTVRLMFDGEIVASMQHNGEELDVRIRAARNKTHGIDAVLEQGVVLPSGGVIALGQLLKPETGTGKGNIRHYNYKRSITVEAEIDKEIINTVEANNALLLEWEKIRAQYPNTDLDFSGALDDIQESMDAMLVLLFVGVGLIYLILGTQFVSYWQPFMILITLPLAFTGVTFGLVTTQNPFSLFTMYGVVALVGISVNASIVLIDAANKRLQAGMTVLHATMYAARRRVVPIVITSLTTIAGLFSLAVGLGGKSLLWGPVASAIVWGLAFSTVLTLFIIPFLYQIFMRRSRKVHFIEPSERSDIHDKQIA